MNQLLEFLNSNAGLVEQFRAMQNRFVFSDGSLASASSALEAFFQRMLTSGIGTVFATLPSVPEGTELIMNHFWQWLNQYITSPMLSTESGQNCYMNLTRLVMKMMLGKENSQFRKAARVFIWVEQDKQNPLDLPKDYQIEQTWSGVACVRQSGHEYGSDGKTHIDQGSSKPARLYVCKCKAVKVGNLEVYVHGVIVQSKVLGVGYADSKDEAAERCYQTFYKALTALKFGKAKEANIGKEAIIFGNWMDMSDYQNLPKPKRDRLSMVATDDRNNQVFVVGLPKLGKDYLISKIDFIKRPSRNFDTSDFTADVAFENGLKLSASLDWRVHKPEQHVEGEVYCDQCKQLYAGVSGCDMRDVKAHGPLCGPCRDYLADLGADFDSLIDV